MKVKENNAIRFCEEFAQTSRPRFAFGVTPYSKDIAKAFPIVGYVDEFIGSESVDGLPVFTRAQLPADAMIVCGIADGYALTAQRNLQDTDLDFIDFYSFYRYFADRLAPVDFYHGNAFIEDYQKNKAEYAAVRGKLADETSRLTFDKLVDFRLTNQISALEGFHCCLEKQYFDLPFIKDYAQCFIDCGGFDGATSLEFARRFPHYQRIELFEPENYLYQLAQSQLKTLRDAMVHPYGVSDRSQQLRFTADGSTSKICSTGENRIQVVALDDQITDRVTFIKMDIEGYERQALAGAKNIIIQQRPLLAICCYHLADDFRKIPEQVLSYYPGYNLYMRHYTEGLLETVFYFVPENKGDE